MSRRNGKSESRGILRVIAAACAIFGVAWLAIAAPFFMRQLDVQRHWPEANALLRSVSVLQDSSGGGNLYKSHFEFDVDTPAGPRSAVIDGYRISSDSGKVQAEAARFQPGVRYSVRRNPNDPTEIRLDVDRPFRHFFLPLTFACIAVLFFGVSGALVLFSRR
jgi:hypothetical protein